MFKKILTSILFVTGMYTGFASAQQGELIVSQNYIKSGCTGWEFREGGPGWDAWGPISTFLSGSYGVM